MPPEQNININNSDQKSNGALIGTIVIIIILLVGGIYLWQKGMEQRRTVEENSNGNTAQVEGELNNMNLDNLDQGI
jgi:hypothetical protein